MSRTKRQIVLVGAVAVSTVLFILVGLKFARTYSSPTSVGSVSLSVAALHDISAPLSQLRAPRMIESRPDCDRDEEGCGTSPNDPDAEEGDATTPPADSTFVTTAGAAVEQRTMGRRSGAAIVASFDGLGVGFSGPAGTATLNNPSDNSLAVGPDHIVQIVNSRMAIFSKKGAMFDTTGKVLYGPVVTNAIFAGFGGPCEMRSSGDAVVRYDQLADRWLYVLPIFSRPQGDPTGPYSMCYAVSKTADPLGPYNRYEFKRPLFPDYPRPAIWIDGYYVPTSTGDNVIQKHACVADRTRMLKGEPATEQCVIIDSVSFLNNADIDGKALPPAGAPNLMIATGGSQLRKVFDDDGLYVWKFHVDWENPANTKVTGPEKIQVAPYHFLCNGQLTNCVTQPDTNRRLDAQGDKIMQRVIYRNINGHEAIVAQHSVNTSTGGGGVRWYELRLNAQRDPVLYQQGTYAPDSGSYRWMASMAMDRDGNIGVGYSFGGKPNYAGQRFAGRMVGDPLGQLTMQETVLVQGQAAQTRTLRWEDYTTTAMDPSDDCTFWYVGDYIQKAANNYSSRIGGFRMPGCMKAEASGRAFYDLNHDGRHDGNEPTLNAWPISVSGVPSIQQLTTNSSGAFSLAFPSDPLFGSATSALTLSTRSGRSWQMTAPSRQMTVRGGDRLTNVEVGAVCTVTSQGGESLRFWTSGSGLRFWMGDGRSLLNAHDPDWRTLVNSEIALVNLDGSRFTVPLGAGDAYEQLRSWLRSAAPPNMSQLVSAQLVSTAFAVAYGDLDGKATVKDPVQGDWPTVSALIKRVNALVLAHPKTMAQAPERAVLEKYDALLEQLNSNGALVSPSTPADCPRP